MKLQLLEKTFNVIETLAEHPRGLAVTRLSGMLQMSVSSVHHILSTLKYRGFVVQDEETKKYSLGFKFLTISRSILDNMDIRKVAHDELRSLHQKVDEMVFLSVLRGGKVVYIDKVQTSGKLVLATDIGFALEPHATTSGKVLLSELSEMELLHIYPEEELPYHREANPHTRTQLMEELQLAREQGLVFGDEQYYPGVRCVAAPIRSGGKIVACLSVTGSVFSMSSERIYTQIIPNVLETSRTISSALH